MTAPPILGDRRDRRLIRLLARLVATLPPTSRITWSNELQPAGVWRVQRGGLSQTGEAPNVLRAILMIGARMTLDPSAPGGVRYVSESGQPIGEDAPGDDADDE